MFPGLTIAYWLTVHGLVTVLAVLFYAVTAHVLKQRRHPTAAIAWVLFILLIPYVALPAFLAFGSRKQARPRKRPAIDAPASGTDRPWAIQTAQALGQPAPVPYSDLHLHADGREALAALWRTIDAAEHSIDLCTFIIGRDAIGHGLIERLAAKARSGVSVRLMLDGLGSLMRRSPKLAPLRAAGAQVTLFVPPLVSPLKGRTNLRDHRKLLIADAGRPGCRLWSGGRNLACEYFVDQAGVPAWHDLTFDLCGPLVAQAHSLFGHDWAFANGQRWSEPVPEAASAAMPEAPVSEAAQPHAAAPSAQLIASGPDQVDDTVFAMLVTGAYRARRRIVLITPYFVPDSALLMALCMAARRGVAVDLLLPLRSNHWMSDVARRRALRTLAAAGARVWLAPRMLHAKLALIDDAVAMSGSANIDSRSLFLNYELMFAFHDTEAVQRFAAWFEIERADAQACVPRSPGFLGDVGEGLVLWTGFQL